MYHVYPINDLRSHEVEGTECWCRPYVEWQDPETGEIHPEGLTIHHSADCREAVEEAEEILKRRPE